MKLLLEDGSAFLMENGSAFLLEEPPVGITPPTRIGFYEPTTGNYSSSTTPKTQTGIDVVAGDLITFIASAEHGGQSGLYITLTPSLSGGSVTWTSQGVSPAAFDTNQSYITVWTGVVGATASGLTFTCVRTGDSNLTWGFGATLWRNHGGVGNVVILNSQSSAQASISCSANSAITGQANDWNAVNGASRTWLSVNGSALSENTYYSNPGVTHTVYGGRSADVGSAGSKTWGLSAPGSGMKAAVGVIEVKGI